MLFDYTNYKEYLNNFVLSKKHRGLTKAELSRTMGCQATYLSQALSGKVHLTEEHLLRHAQSLEFSEIETEYLLTLLRLAKAAAKEHRHYLEMRLENLRTLKGELEARVSKQSLVNDQDIINYYASSWIPSVIHVATDCEEFKSSKAISQRFGLPEKIVLSHLSQLEKFELVDFRDGKWHMTKKVLHFSKNLQMDLLLQTGRRLLALHRLSFRKDSNLHYSLVFASDSKTISNLRNEFLNNLERVHKTVLPSQSEDIYGICLDLFLV